MEHEFIKEGMHVQSSVHPEIHGVVISMRACFFDENGTGLRHVNFDVLEPYVSDEERIRDQSLYLALISR